MLIVHCRKSVRLATAGALPPHLWLREPSTWKKAVHLGFTLPPCWRAGDEMSGTETTFRGLVRRTLPVKGSRPALHSYQCVQSQLIATRLAQRKIMGMINCRNKIIGTTTRSVNKLQNYLCEYADGLWMVNSVSRSRAAPRPPWAGPTTG